MAIGLINEALDEGDAQKTLQALQIPAAKLEGVLAEVAQHYQDMLIRAKREKAQVRGARLVLTGSSQPLWSKGGDSHIALSHSSLTTGETQKRQMLHLLGTHGIPLLQMSL